MDDATCTEDGHNYNAIEFSRLSPSDLERKRRQLICTECHNPAFFRKESRDGRGACFGARPHIDGCSRAVEDRDLRLPGMGDGQDELINFNNRIIVDLDFGAAEPPTHFDPVPGAPLRPRAGAYVGGDGPRVANMHRRLRPLLRLLVESPNFRHSDVVIALENRSEMSACDFFVNFGDVDAGYAGSLRGYWGQLTDAREGANGVLWLNTGGQGDMSIGLPPELRADLMGRFDLEIKEEFAGAYILVIGEMRVSQHGKMVCIIDDLAMVTIR
ncbi:hypothetical protein IM543_09060 [Massilia sp. UMI-21]|nr:hypothetical protein IM543_09060 [Massilia sp. UMI-21]